MSEQPDIDARIAALLADPQPARPDSAFADRIVALAAYDLSTRKSRHRALIQVGRETLGLAAVLASFAILARAGPLPAGLRKSGTAMKCWLRPQRAWSLPDNPLQTSEKRCVTHLWLDISRTG